MTLLHTTVLQSLEELSETIDLVRVQRDLALQALKNIIRADTVEEAREIALGVSGAIDACDEDETITITTRDYTADVDEGESAA